MSIHVQSFDTLHQAREVLGSSSRYIGGGTLLMRQVNYGDQSFDQLVHSGDPALKEIHIQGDDIRLGAGVTMTEILQHPQLEFLSEVARSVGGPAIRNMATIGGNLFAPRPYGDMTTALLALNADLQWASGRQGTVEEFLEQTFVDHDIVTSLSFQRPASGAFRYLKVSRVKPKGVALITIAALLNRDSGRIGNVRIVFGGMAPKPRRAKASELSLQGALLDEAGIQRCLDTCTEGMEPADDSLSSSWYRNEVAPVYLKRLLLQRSAG